MIVDIKNIKNGEGWGRYVAGRDQNREGAVVIAGDIELGDRICRQLDYASGNAVNFVISFSDEDNVSQERGREIVQSFMREFLHGFREDEYHIDIVEHNDTDHLHFHARIPKLNLLTGTQLKLYFHKTDLEYKKAVIDTIADRYNLTTGANFKQAFPANDAVVKRIEKWRKDRNQKPFDFSKKKKRNDAEDEIYISVLDAFQIGRIATPDDLRAHIADMGLEIVREGYDRQHDFWYYTVQNDTGKLRMKGDIFNPDFFDFEPSVMDKAVINNIRQSTEKKDKDEIAKRLDRERKKRLKWIEKQYGGARKRALSDLDKAIEEITTNIDQIQVQEEIDDSIRVEVDATIRRATSGIRERVEEDHGTIRNSATGIFQRLETIIGRVGAIIDRIGTNIEEQIAKVDEIEIDPTIFDLDEQEGEKFRYEVPDPHNRRSAPIPDEMIEQIEKESVLPEEDKPEAPTPPAPAPTPWGR